MARFNLFHVVARETILVFEINLVSSDSNEETAVDEARCVLDMHNALAQMDC